MVNYCCVHGCGRNSRLFSHLNYYSLPKERHRQVEWLQAAGRPDLLHKEQGRLTVSHRFCSRHFTPASIKNRHLCSDAVPTLHLPSAGSESEGESEEEPLPRSNVVCDNCRSPIPTIGFRYKCVSCRDYDLCQKCEMLEVHPDHFMLRIPKPMKFKLADNLIKKWRRFFKSAHVTPASAANEAIHLDSASSDDEPITKYAKNYDSGVDLSEDVKTKIRDEVTRMLNQKPEKRPKVPKVTPRTEKRKTIETPKASKKPRLDRETDANVVCEVLEKENSGKLQEVAFADVNAMKDLLVVDMKDEFQSVSADPALSLAAASTSQGSEEHQQPVMHVKLSDDLSELMIEVTSNNQKTVYKYT